jgi:hypothetical protein
MTPTKTLTLSLFTLCIGACGSSPALTETTTTTSVQRTDSGGEVRSSSTETREVADDGSQTIDRTETTQTTTPPSKR